MAGYILRRTLLVIPVVLGAVTMLFLVFFIIPGDPVEQLGGGTGKALTAQERINIEQKYGLDKPWYDQYGTYMGHLVKGDLGRSYTQGRDVSTLIKETAPASLRLALWAILLEIAIGIAAGIVAAVRQYSFLDGLTTVSTTMVVGIP